jgi:4-hydroxy-tetrahydrodipicolinate reductase
VKIAVHGAGGRMGQAVIRLLEEHEGTLVGAIEARHAPSLGKDAGDLAGAGHLGVAVTADISAGLLGADAVIDFSRHAAVPALLHAAMRAKVPVISGTTGLDTTSERLLDEVARVAPVLWAPNMSLGVHVLAELARLAVRKLGAGFDVEIVETHHSAKIDAPSGTALRLVDAVREERTRARSTSGREGQVGPRGDDEIGVFAMRGGDVIGDHSVHLLGHGERVELTHRATNRDLFARGALVATRAMLGRPPGRYTMADVVK